MTRPLLLSARLSLLLLATISTGSLAQTTVPVPVRDSLALAREDSVREGRNWLSGLLRRIGRRSDDSLQVAAAPDAGSAADAPLASPVSARAFSSRKDSVAWENARRTAARASGFHLVVDVFAHELYVINAKGDTLRKAPAATASNATLAFGGRTWHFETPRGVRMVTAKDSEPVWRPPDWHFAEVALEHGLKVRYLERGRTVRLQDGTKLKIEGDEVGIIAPGEREFQPLVLDMHVVFDNTLFVPPVDTKHRQVEGELGHFRLRLGDDGYMLHGTPYANSIGASVTHGCVRLHDDDIEWLYNNVPLGTKVYIY
ncbi:MAG: ErfK/YbiS/YcfS/YnhG family protein [Gemmatimonadetes bacterium]|jgi:hypothetical protein|nr:ErfK/YbiS/YcfS/YnhG family protein [Gemmatimonadota bacterium]